MIRQCQTRFSVVLAAAFAFGLPAAGLPRGSAAEGDGDDLFGGGQPWPNGPDRGAEESPDRLGCRREEDLREVLGDDPTRMWRWQAAIFRRTAFGAPGPKGTPAGHPTCGGWRRRAAVALGGLALFIYSR